MKNWNYFAHMHITRYIQGGKNGRAKSLFTFVFLDNQFRSKDQSFIELGFRWATGPLQKCKVVFHWFGSSTLIKVIPYLSRLHKAFSLFIHHACPTGEITKQKTVENHAEKEKNKTMENKRIIDPDNLLVGVPDVSVRDCLLRVQLTNNNNKMKWKGCSAICHTPSRFSFQRDSFY